MWFDPPADEVEEGDEEPRRDRHPRRLEGVVGTGRPAAPDPGRHRRRRRRRRADHRRDRDRDPPARRRQRRQAGSTFRARSAPARAAPGADNPQPLPPGEDPQADLKDFSTYVFDDTQDVWERIVRGRRRPLRHREARPLLGRRPDRRLRQRDLRGRPVLLPGRRARLSRPELLRGHEAPARRLRRLRLGIRDRPRDGPPRPAATGTSAEVDRLSRPTPARRTSSRSARSCRPTATPASGPAPSSPPATSSPATSTRPSTPPRRSATTGSSSRPTGRVNPDSFTHGTSEQRRSWFERGYELRRPGRLRHVLSVRHSSSAAPLAIRPPGRSGAQDAKVREAT